MNQEAAIRKVAELYAEQDPMGPRRYSKITAVLIDNDDERKGDKVVGRRQGDHTQLDELAR